MLSISFLSPYQQQGTILCSRRAFSLPHKFFIKSHANKVQSICLQGKLITALAASLRVEKVQRVFRGKFLSACMYKEGSIGYSTTHFSTTHLFTCIQDPQSGSSLTGRYVILKAHPVQGPAYTQRSANLQKIDFRDFSCNQRSTSVKALVTYVSVNSGSLSGLTLKHPSF